jgi:hypothetical protein
MRTNMRYEYMHDSILLEILKVAMRIVWFADSYLSILYGLRSLFRSLKWLINTHHYNRNSNNQ